MIKRFKTFLSEGLLKEELTDRQKLGFTVFSRGKGYPINSDASPSENARKLTDHIFGDKDSIEIPAINSTYQTIKDHLSKHGYNDIDYANKTASKLVELRDGTKKLQSKRIGSILTYTGASNNLINSFTRDNHQEAVEFSKKHKIIISRNPFHIASCSTNPDNPNIKTSCAELNNDGNPSSDNPNLAGHKLPAEIYHGTHVAYLVPNEDKPHSELIDRASSRILLKPFANSSGHTVLIPESKAYSINDTPQGFHDSLTHFANTNLPLEKNVIYRKHESLYDDGKNHVMHIDLNKEGYIPNVSKHVASSPLTEKHITDFISNIHNSPNKELLNYVIRNDSFSNDHVKQIFDSGAYRHLNNNGIKNISSRNLSEEHINKLIDHFSNIGGSSIDADIAIKLIDQKKFNDNHFSNLLNIVRKNPSRDDIVYGLSRRSSKLKPQHINDMLGIKYIAGSSALDFMGDIPNLSKENITSLINHKSDNIDYSLIYNKKAHPEHLDTLIDRHFGEGKPFMQIHKKLLSNYTLSEPQLKKVMDTNNPMMHNYLNSAFIYNSLKDEENPNYELYKKLKG